MHAAHLYAWRQVESIDAIFGLSAKADVFSPENSLFLERLKKQLIRVSSLLYPMLIWNWKTRSSSCRSCRTKSATGRKLRWKNTRWLFQISTISLSMFPIPSITILAQLDERPLKFHTHFRPRARSSDCMSTEAKREERIAAKRSKIRHGIERHLAVMSRRICLEDLSAS